MRVVWTAVTQQCFIFTFLSCTKSLVTQNLRSSTGKKMSNQLQKTHNISRWGKLNINALPSINHLVLVIVIPWLLPSSYQNQIVSPPLYSRSKPPFWPDILCTSWSNTAQIHTDVGPSIKKREKKHSQAIPNKNNPKKSHFAEC